MDSNELKNDRSKLLRQSAIVHLWEVMILTRKIPTYRRYRAFPAHRLLGLAGISPMKEKIMMRVPEKLRRSDFLKVLRDA